MKYIEVEFESKDNPGCADPEYSIAIKADHYPTLSEVEEFVRKDMIKLGYAKVHGCREITEKEIHDFYNDENIDKWPILTKKEKQNMEMKIKYEVVVDNMEEFSKAHSIVEELCHLYDGVGDKEKCLTFANAASYMLDIINGEQNNTKEV